MQNNKNYFSSTPKYSKICKNFYRINFLKFLSLRIENERLNLATQHFFDKYLLSPQEISCTAIFIFFLFIFISIMLTFFFISLIFLIFGFSIGYIFYNLILNKLILEYEKEKLLILQYIEIAFQEFLIILSTTKSIFDSIFYISQGRYPYISKKFREMIQSINEGADPESSLYNFAINQPSEPLRERILNIIATNYSQNTIIEEFEKNLVEKENEYETYTKQLDSSLILIIGISSFIPILFTITVLLNGWENNVWIIIFIFLFLILINYLKNFLLKSKFLIFGSFENEKSNTSKKKLDKMKLEFEELVTFLSFFGNFLKRNFSIEMALIEAVYKYKGILKPKFLEILNNILLNNISFESAWDKFSQSFLNDPSNKVLSLIKRMLLKDSIEAGFQIISLLTQLKKNQNLIQKREIIYKTQQFKIKLISLISGFILGLLISLAPLFSLAFSFSNLSLKFQNLLFKFINYYNFMPLILTIISNLIISSYNLAKIVQINNPFKNILITLMTFGVTWYFGYLYFSYII